MTNDTCEHGVPIAEHCQTCDADECDLLPRFGGVSPDDMLAEPSGDGYRLAVWLLLVLAGAVVGVLIATRSP